MKPELRLKGFDGEWKEIKLSDCLSISDNINKQNKYDKDDVLSVSDEVGVVNQIQHLGRSYAGKSVTGYKILEKNQVVYTKSPLKEKPFGIIKVNNYNVGIVSVLYAVYDVSDGVCPEYIQRYFDPCYRINNYFRPLVNKGAKNTMNISDEMSLQGFITIPNSIDEQREIAKYFQQLDSQIQSCAKQVESLKRVKAASLQSMFPQEGETTPRVRFKGFDGEFEDVCASDVFKTFNEKNRPDLPVLSATQDKGMVTRDEIGYNIFHDQRNEATYKHILPGQFVIHLRSFQGGFAHSAIEGIASPAYTVMEFKDKSRHYDIYWKYIFMSKEFIKRLELITYGIRDGRTISFDEFSAMHFTVPSFAEQQKIADFFTNLDKQISLETQKLEKLKQIKAACLDKMFV